MVAVAKSNSAGDAIPFPSTVTGTDTIFWTPPTLPTIFIAPSMGTGTPFTSALPSAPVAPL